MYLLAILCLLTGFAEVKSEFESVIDGEQSNYQIVQDDPEPLFDVEKNYEIEQVRKLFADEGINLSYDSAKGFNIFGAIGQLFRSGDARRYSILNLAYQLSCYQGRKGTILRLALWALSRYRGYGCYCGSSHYSGNYIDETDRCCKEHNKCYKEAQQKYNIGNSCRVFTTQYSVSCCNKQKYTKCTDSGPSAARALCDCDQAMASCISSKKASGTYRKKYLHNRQQCHSTSSHAVHVHKSTSLVSSLLKQCKAPASPVKTFPIKYGSQGKCPAKKSSGWWIFGKDQ